MEIIELKGKDLDRARLYFAGATHACVSDRRISKVDGFDVQHVLELPDGRYEAFLTVAVPEPS